jgi:hypothetical protein
MIRTPPREPKAVPGPFVAAGLIMAVAVVVLVGRAGRAEDDRIVDDELIGGESGNPAMVGGGENVQNLGMQFDANLLANLGQAHVMHAPPPTRPAGTVGGSREVKEPEESAFVGAMRKAIEPRLTHVEAVCRPSADQRRLLRLALEADVRRTAAEIERERRKYVDATANLNDPAGQQKWQQFHQDIQRCQKLIQGFTRDVDGLFSKSLSTVLDGEQVSRLEAETRSAQAYRWKAYIGLALARWDEMLGLDQNQYVGLEKLLVEKQPALRIFVGPAGSQPAAQQAMWLVPLALDEVGEKRAREVISDRQWKLLSRTILQAKQMRPHLEQTGILEPRTK